MPNYDKSLEKNFSSSYEAFMVKIINGKIREERIEDFNENISNFFTSGAFLVLALIFFTTSI
ncbi:MAG: hypothetical protein II961_06875 [Candidatus Riflebacteria bacterium]|nr:hypothetical protein [Candidatus Riflebacteria bacterium]